MIGKGHNELILLWRWCLGCNPEIVYSTRIIQGGWKCLEVYVDTNSNPLTTVTYDISEFI